MNLRFAMFNKVKFDKTRFNTDRSRKTKLLIATALICCWLPPVSASAQVSLSQPVPQLPAVDTANYRLGPGDQIDISVFGYEEYTGSLVILPDGTIALPVVGSVPAANRTASQLEQELSNRLQSLLVDPVVTVRLTTLRPVLVNVSGEVRRPGPVQLSSPNNTAIGTVTGNQTTVTGAPTITAALIQAGGITQNADIRQVMLRRAGEDANAPSTVLNLWDSLSSDSSLPSLALRDGDSVYVPRLRADATVDRRLLVRSSFSPTTVRVRVVGEVTNPGELQISPDSSLSSVVASAGGPTHNARLRDVRLIRLGEDGRITTQEVDLSSLQDNYQVQEGDVVVVPEQGTSSFIRGFGQALSPVGTILNLFGRFLGF